MDPNQLHILRLSITVKKILLTVRFPCSLSFQARVDTNIVENKNTYELKKGQAQINQTVKFEGEFQYNGTKRKYEDKKIMITVFMNSMNGKIPAGSITLIISDVNMRSTQQTVALQKCPDKNAKITFLHSSQFVRKLQTIKSPVKQRSIVNKNFKSSQVNAYTPKQQINFPQSFRVNKVDEDGKARTLQISRQKYRFKTQLINDIESPKRLGSRVLDGSINEENFSQQQKVLRLQRQKSQYIKDIAKLKGQLHTLNMKNQDKTTQSNLQLVTQQLNKAKERIRIYEKTEKELNVQIRQLRQQLQKKKVKIQTLQAAKSEVQIQLQKKEFTIRDLQSNRKKLQVSIEDANVQLSSLIKKLQFKDQSHKEQMKKLMDKYTQAENERVKATQDLDSMIGQMQFAEKQNQIILKQKQKVFQDEKGKLIIKIQQLTKVCDDMQIQIAEKDAQLHQIGLLQKRTKMSEEEKADQLSKTTSQLFDTKQKLKKESQARKLLQKENQELKLIEQQRNTLKKKYNETLQQLTKLKQKHEKLNHKNMELQTIIKNLEETNKTKVHEKAEVQSKFLHLTKNYDNLRRQDQKKLREAETLSVQNFSAGQKIIELKNKLQSQRDKFAEIQSEFHAELTYRMKQKQELQADLDEAKWNLQKNKQSYEELLQKMRQLNQQRLLTHKQNMQKTQLLKSLTEQNIELKTQKEKLLTKIQILQVKQRENLKKMQQKNDRIYELQKKIGIIQQNVLMLKEKNKNYQLFYSEKLGSEEAINKEKDRLLNQKIDENTELQVQIMELNSELINIEQDNKVKSNDIAHQKQQIISLKGALEEQGSTSEELRKQLDSANNSIGSLMKQISGKVQQLATSEKNNVRLKSDWENYKIQNEKAVNQLVKQLSKDDCGVPLNLASFPDVNLSMLQTQVIKKRNTIISTYRDRISKLQQQYKIIEAQFDKARKIWQNNEVEYEKQIKMLKEKIQSQLVQITTQKHTMFQNISHLEENNSDLNSTIQKLNFQLMTCNEIIEELNNQLADKNKQIENLVSEIKISQQQILVAKSQTNKLQKLTENDMSSLLERSNAQQQKLKITIIQLQKKNLTNEKIINEKQQYIKNLEKSITSLTYEKDKLIDNIGTLNEKINDYITMQKLTEKQKQGLEKNIKQLNENIDGLSRDLKQQETKNKQLQSQLTKTNQQLLNAQILLQQSDEQLKHSNALVKSLEKSLSQTSNKGKYSGNKYQTEIKDLNEKIIKLNSDIELKNFLIKQHQNSIQQLRTENQNIQVELENKKGEILVQGNKIEELKCELMFRGQSEETLTNDKTAISLELEEVKQKLLIAQEENSKNMELQSLFETSQLQLERVKNQLENYTRLVQQNTADLKASQVENRRQIINRNSKEEQYRRRIRDLERFLQQKDIDLASQRKKWLAESDKQRGSAEFQMKNMRDRVKNLESELKFQQEKYNQDMESYQNQCMNLQSVIAEKQSYIQSQAAQIKDYEKKNENLTKQLKNCLEVWDKEKIAYQASRKQMSTLQNEMGRFQRYATQLDSRSKQLIEVSKKKINDDNGISMGDKLRQIQMMMMKSKTKALGRSHNQQQKQIVINDFKSIQQKLDELMKMQAT